MLRATFSGFSTALSAIQANQKRLDIVGQNLSNMNTQGYTRQQLEASSLNYSRPISRYMNDSQVAVGFGVSMDRISQIRDPYLDAQYRSQMKKAGYSDAMQTSLDRLSKVLDESDKDGIRQALADIQSTLSGMHDSSNVIDAVYESELRSRMQSLTNLLNDSARQILDAEKAEFSKLDGTGTNEQGAVQKVNDLLRQIGDLNHQIKDNQVLGQQSLELLDQRNMLLDELSSYVPIEVSYFKDAAHDGKTVDNNGTVVDAPNELYEYDSNGNIVGKKEWPDDLKVEMVYQDTNGLTKRLTLVDGSTGTVGQNYGSLSIATTAAGDPTTAYLTFTAASSTTSGTNPAATVKASATGAQFSGGSIQASLDMLGKAGTGAGDDVRGYQYYMKQLDELAIQFANTMNSINKAGNGGVESPLFANKNDPADPVDALTIGISKEWRNGTVHIGTSGSSPNSTVLDMLEAMQQSHTQLGDKSFADYINNVSTTLANDSSSNINSLKTNVTVLNSIQDSRDNVSGVSLDEEASNMMSYISAYNAASRLMTALDEALNTLISGTGLVGR